VAAGAGRFPRAGQAARSVAARLRSFFLAKSKNRPAILQKQSDVQIIQ